MILNNKVAIVVSKFNEKITENLLQGALACSDNQCEVDIYKVPGAFEIPAFVKQILQSEKNIYSGILTLGCIIKGETAHFDYISSSVLDSLSKISIDSEIPITLGILTTYNSSQAITRSSLDNIQDNKGYEAMLATIESIENFNQLK